jgi:Xaa-Pro aminopeptidase
MNSTFFIDNRRRLSRMLGSSPIVMSAYTQLQRGNDAAFAFEQEANFWWLTGIEAPDWQLIIDPIHKKNWLVAPEIDAVHQVFDGSLSLDEALAISGADAVLQRAEAEEKITELARQHAVVFTLGDDPAAAHYDFTRNPAPDNLKRRLARIFTEVRSVRRDIARLRAIKQPEEIEAMQAAIDLTVGAYEHVRGVLATCKYEYEVEAEFSYYFRRRGAAGHAYDPIVAAGAHACTLHYNANNGILRKGQLLLLDIGARYQGYAADITRTYAVGKPTNRQVAVHAAVADAQRQIIDLLRPGLAVKEYHEAVDRLMVEALLSLGLMKDVSDTTAYHHYFPHAVSHGLGVDVHDSLGGPVYLEPGMVLTVEPGIYIPEEGIGVRIEDDILITADGHRNLTAALSTDLA